MACRDLVAHRVGVADQQRAHLRAGFPGGAGLFEHIDSQISLALVGVNVVRPAGR